MASDKHEALIRGYMNEVFNGHRLDSLEEVLGQRADLALVGHEDDPRPARLAGWDGGLLRRFPGRRLHTSTTCSLWMTAASGVVIGSRPRGGQWQGIAASGRSVTWTVIIIGRFEHGKLKEDWVELDRLGLLQQLGCIPTGS